MQDWERSSTNKHTNTIILRQRGLIILTAYERSVVKGSINQWADWTCEHCCRVKIAAAHETNERAEFNLCSHLKVVQQTFFKYISDTDTHTQRHKHTHACAYLPPNHYALTWDLPELAWLHHGLTHLSCVSHEPSTHTHMLSHTLCTFHTCRRYLPPLLGSPLKPEENAVTEPR